MGKSLRLSLTYRSIVAGGVVVFVVLVSLVVLDKLSVEQGTFAGSLLAAILTIIFIAEIREDRIEQHRPIVVVEIDDQLELVGAYQSDFEIPILLGTRLIVRNDGAGAAKRIKITLREPFKAADGTDVANNQLIREGIPFLGSGKTISLKLNSSDFRHVRGQPLKSLETDVTITYEDVATGRPYEESYPLGFGLHMHGWIDPNSSKLRGN